MRKIQKLSLIMGGLILAVGAGAGLTQIRDVKSAKAETNTANFTLADGVFSTVDNNGQIVWSLESGKVTLSQLNPSAGDADPKITNVSSNYISAPRVYRGHILKLSGIDGFKIVSAKLTYNGTYYGNDIKAGVTFTTGNSVTYAGSSSDTTYNDLTIVTDDTTKVTKSLGTKSGGYHLFSAVDSTNGVDDLYIQNYAHTKNTQFRITAVQVTYVVGQAAANPDTISVTGNATVNVGEKITLTATCTKEGSSSNVNQEVEWSSSDESVATVSSTGVVTGIKNGTVNIIATSSVDNTISGSLSINVSGQKSTDSVLYLDKNTPIASSGYVDGLYPVDGIALSVTSVYTNSNKYLQFKKGSGVLENATELPASIQSIDIKFNADNTGVVTVEVSGDGINYTSVTGTTQSFDELYSVYTVSGQNKFFKFSATNDALLLIDTIGINLGNSDEGAAKTFAARLDGECTGTGDANPITAEAWNEIATAYTSLTEDAKKVITKTTATGYAFVDLFLNRYDYIVSTYNYSNFLNRTIATRSMNNFYKNTEGMTIVIVASALAITSAAAIAVLAVLKRKKRASK